MTDYTKATNFATKDALPSGNPAKIVKGTEIDTEFNNVAIAVATKSNSASPTFTGTLTAPALSITGNTVLGNDASDTITFTGDVASNILPSADDTYDLGATASRWKDIYIDGVAYVDAIDFAGTGITATAAELNILDGVTATFTELNLLDGVTSTTAELNILDGVTATAAEINVLDGITATVAELNILDGVTATAAELNYTDGVTSNIQTQIDALQDLDADLTAIAALTPTDSNFIVGNGTTWVQESGATVRTSLGLTIGTDVQAYSSVLAGTTASFTTADETKLDGIEAGATADQTSIVGISGTTAQFNTANSDGTFAISGGAFHDGFSDFVANEHIDWTSTSSAFSTTGTLASGALTVTGTGSTTGNFTVGAAGSAGSTILAIKGATGGALDWYAGATRQWEIYNTSGVLQVYDIVTNAARADFTTTGLDVYGNQTITSSGATIALTVTTSNTTAQNGLYLNADSVTSGRGLHVFNNNASFTSSNGLAKINVANASATGIALNVTNAGTGDAVLIDQNGNGTAILVDSESTTAAGVDIRVDTLTTGTGLNVYSASADTNVRILHKVYQAAAAATQTRLAYFQSDATTNTYPLVEIDQNGNGTAFAISNTGTGNALSADGGNIVLTNGIISATGPTGANAVYYLTSAAGYNTYLELGNSTAGYSELVSDNSGNFILNHFGVAAGAIVSYRSGAVANTLVLNAGTVSHLKGISVGGATPGTGGIAFPATAVAVADANTLDDYEEGTFTPTLGGTTTYTVQSGKYTKIGDRVFFTIQFAISAIGTGSTTQISGLPFTTGGIPEGATVAYFSSSATNIVSLYAQIPQSNTVIDLYSQTAAASGLGANAIFTGSTSLQINGHYDVA
jgi:hypothetical protein